MGLSVNRLELIGNLGRDPEIRIITLGKKIATLSIAISESWKDQQSGEWRERSEWHRVVVFNDGLAGVVEKHLSSGMKVRIEGKLRTRKWQDPSGADLCSTEIHVENFDGSINFDMKRNDDRVPTGNQREAAHTGAGANAGDMDDEISF